MAELWLTGAAYQLGGQSIEPGDLPSLPEALLEKKLPNDLKLLGIGKFHRIVDLYGDIEKSAAKTLAKSDLSGEDVDCVIFCSSRFHHDASAQNKGYARALIANGIAPRSLFCISGTGCVSVLTGINLAKTLAFQKGLENFLVVNIDFVEEQDDMRRVCPHALLSDGVSSVVVSRNRRHETSLRLQSFVEKTDVQKMRDGIQLKDFASGRDVIAACLRDAEYPIERVEKILSNNIFLPLKKIKESAHGFSEAQMYFENVARNGHCYASDILINLSDYLESNTEPSGGFVLYSEADGHTACLLASPPGA